jgi:hypothetical protein
MEGMMKQHKQYELYRVPYFRNPEDGPGVRRRRMPEPDRAKKIVTARNRDDLLVQAKAYGDEYGKACEVSMTCQSGRGFQRTRYVFINCNDDNAPPMPEQWMV